MPAVRPARERQRQVDRLPLRQLRCASTTCASHASTSTRVACGRTGCVSASRSTIAHRCARSARGSRAARLLPPAIAGQRVSAFSRIAPIGLRISCATCAASLPSMPKRSACARRVRSSSACCCSRSARRARSLNASMTRSRSAADVRQMMLATVAAALDPREVALPSAQRHGQRGRDRQDHGEDGREARGQQLAVPAQRRARTRQHPHVQPRSAAYRAGRRDHGILRAFDDVRGRGTRRGRGAQRAEDQRRFRFRYVVFDAAAPGRWERNTRKPFAAGAAPASRTRLPCRGTGEHDVEDRIISSGRPAPGDAEDAL